MKPRWTEPAGCFSFRSRIQSFTYALKGIWLLFVGQHNARIHAGVTVAIIAAGFAFRLARLEWCAVVIAIMSVWTAEALNTAFEFLCDVASPQFHPMVEKAKDVAAGAVLLSALGSAIVGLLIFGPHLLGLLRGI